MISAAEFKEFGKQSRPFQIYLADGRKLQARNGEHLSLRPDGKMFLLWTTRGGLEVLDVAMVKAIAMTEKPRRKLQPKN